MYTSLIAVISTALLAVVSAQSTTEPITGIRGNATVIENNPVGKVYTATLPEKPFFNPTNPKGNVKGSISATANPNGIGVKFIVKFENLPTSGGPFRAYLPTYTQSFLSPVVLSDLANSKETVYHLHDAPVPADGNCTKTLAHADPYIRGEVSLIQHHLRSRFPTQPTHSLANKTKRKPTNSLSRLQLATPNSHKPVKPVTYPENTARSPQTPSSQPTPTTSPPLSQASVHSSETARSSSTTPTRRGSLAPTSLWSARTTPLLLSQFLTLRLNPPLSLALSPPRPHLQRRRDHQLSSRVVRMQVLLLCCL